MVPTEQCYTLPLLWIEWKEAVITEVPFAPLSFSQELSTILKSCGVLGKTHTFIMESGVYS